MRSFSALALFAVPAVLYAGCGSDDASSASASNPDSGVPISDGGNPALPDASSPGDASSDAGVSITGDFTSAFSLGATTVGMGVATDKNGDVVIVGTIEGTVTINGLSYVSADRDVLVVRLAANNGVKWAKNIGSAKTDDGRAVAIDANGDVYIAGDYNGGGAASATFGSNALTAQHSGYSSFVAKLDGTNGNMLWAQSFDAAASSHQCTHIAAGPSSVAVGCSVSGTVAYTDTNGTPGTRAATTQNAWIAELDPATGKLARGLLMSGSTSVTDLAFDSANNLYAWGQTSSNPVGDTPSFTLNKTGTTDAWLIALATPAAGVRSLAWSKVYGAAGATTNANGVSIAPDGSLYVNGLFGGTHDFGKGQMTAAGAMDAFVLHVASNDGATLAQTQYGASGTALFGGLSGGIAVDDVGNPIVANYYRNTGFTLGGVVLPNTDTTDDASAFVTKLSPDLSKIAYVKLTQGKASGAAGVRHYAIATNGATGQSVTVGMLGGTADLGNGQDTAVTPGGLYMIRRAR